MELPLGSGTLLPSSRKVLRPCCRRYSCQHGQEYSDEAPFGGPTFGHPKSEKNNVNVCKCSVNVQQRFKSLRETRGTVSCSSKSEHFGRIRNGGGSSLFSLLSMHPNAVVNPVQIMGRCFKCPTKKRGQWTEGKHYGKPLLLHVLAPKLGVFRLAFPGGTNRFKRHCSLFSSSARSGPKTAELLRVSPFGEGLGLISETHGVADLLLATACDSMPHVQLTSLR